MDKEFLKEVNDCYLGFYVNLDASGIDNEDENLSADDFDHVEYYIKDNKLYSWNTKELFDLSELDDSWWKENEASQFECFLAEVINYVIQNELIGSDEFLNLVDDNRILLVLLKNSEDDIIEEVSEWDINEWVD